MSSDVRMQRSPAVADRRVLTDEEIDADIRSWFVPLYPPDKPLEEMTPYEQSTFRRMRSEYRRIEALVLERHVCRLPENGQEDK